MIAKIGWFWVELADLNRIRKIPFQKSMQIYNDKNYDSTLFSLFLGRFEPIWEGSEDGIVGGRGGEGDYKVGGQGMRLRQSATIRQLEVALTTVGNEGVNDRGKK